jgi:hypothetical protein
MLFTNIENKYIDRSCNYPYSFLAEKLSCYGDNQNYSLQEKLKQFGLIRNGKEIVQIEEFIQKIKLVMSKIRL